VNEPDATVWIVDDDHSVRRGLARLLRSAGYRVETFTSAHEFLERGDLDGLGCLIVDVRMPKVGGLDLQQMLADQGRNIPMIFITGYGDIPMAVRAMKMGAIDFLTKPFDDQVLLDAVQQALGRAQ